MYRLNLVLLLLLAGCASPGSHSRPTARQFDFSKDTFAYANELVWDYSYTPDGQWTTKTRDPKPSYYQHCFVMARSALQFYENARFAPELPKVSDSNYRDLIRRLVAVSPKHQMPERRKTVIPGYANLREFSSERPDLLKAECGSPVQCYLQRGNWRMVLPFPRSQQARIAQELVAELKEKPLVVHIARFPALSINHAVLLFSARETETEIMFSTYDPNTPTSSIALTYSRQTRTFSLAPNNYFQGGRVDVYPIYRGLCY